MSPGIWIAVTTLAAFWGFGLWIASTRRFVTGRRWKAGLLFALGVALAAFGLWSDARLRRETLFEVVAPVTNARELEHAFEVLHPGVEHTLIVYPEYPMPAIRYSDFAAEVRVRIVDAVGRTLVAGAHVHAPHAWERYWRDQRYPFVPTSAGRHTLVLVPVTPGIPAIHARIVDPLGVPDDRRAPGY